MNFLTVFSAVDLTERGRDFDMTQIYRGTEGKKISIFLFTPYTMHNNVFSFFSGMSVVFPCKKNVFIAILRHRHCRSEWRSQRSFLQLMTYDMGKTCENAPYRSSV